MIHSTVPPGQVNWATVHATVSEFWHVLSGEGQIWRRDGTGEETTVLARGVSIDIPVGTAFQYRCTGVDPLQFLCITMPRWPGDKEATVIEGPTQVYRGRNAALAAASGWKEERREPSPPPHLSALPSCRLALFAVDKREQPEWGRGRVEGPQQPPFSGKVRTDRVIAMSPSYGNAMLLTTT